MICVKLRIPKGRNIVAECFRLDSVARRVGWVEMVKIIIVTRLGVISDLVLETIISGSLPARSEENQPGRRSFIVPI